MAAPVSFIRLFGCGEDIRMRTFFGRVAAVGLIGLALAGRAATQDNRDSLAAPVAIAVNGVPLDAPIDDKGGFVYDNACPWVGDFDGKGKLALLIGTRDYRFHPRGKEQEGRPGRLRVYRNLADKGSWRLAEPVWFDDLVPTGRVPQG
jgi:hypothetical protein